MVADVARGFLLHGRHLVVLPDQGVGVVEHRSVRGQGFVHGGRHREPPVAHAHQRQGLVGHVAGFRRHRHHGLAHVAHPVGGDERPVPQAVAVVGIDVLDGLAGEDAVDARIAPRPARTSMLSISAWGNGLRRTLPSSSPGKSRSAVNRALPVTFSTPSVRRMERPTVVSCSSTSLGSRLATLRTNGWFHDGDDFREASVARAGRGPVHFL